MIKRGAEISEQYVKWLSELSKASGPIAGGKGANLAEMYNSGFPVPPAFCITAQAFEEFIKKAGLKQEIIDIIAKTNVDNTKELDKNSENIRELITNAHMPDEMEREIIEAYGLLSTESGLKNNVPTNISKNAMDILKHGQEPVFVAVRSSATTEDLAAASFAGQQETYTNIRGNKELIHAVKKCMASLFTARAVYYRHKQGFDKANALLSVVVQKMINSEKSGVMFTKNPVNGANEIIVEAVWGLGEGIVSGKIMPDHYVLSQDIEIKDKVIVNKKTAIIRAGDGNEKVIELSPEKSKHQVLTTSEIMTLGKLGSRLEQHYGKPQDIEFALEDDIVYIVQTRPITTLEKAVTKTGTIEGKLILTGSPASPGVAIGKVKIVHTMEDLSKVLDGDVLVTKMTNPDMVVTMQRAVAIITDEGGATSHAAIVSREMGIPCIVGTETATKILSDGMVVTIDGINGKVYEGEASALKEKAHEGKKEIQAIVRGTKTKIKVMVDLPDFAERSAKTGCEAVGLVRLEGIIAESGKHPLLFEHNKNPEKYSEIIERGIAKIAEHFKEMWIRTSDIRSDEYQNLEGAPKEIEVNPMLGMHGIRFSLKHLALFEAEISAIMRVAIKHPDKKFGLMFPQVISEGEMADAYKVFKRYQKPNMIIGAMIETPAAVQVIRGICKYAKFISFGTNDLTQFTLAIDRGNSECQYMYNEMHPGVLSQLKRVIDICREYKVQTSICGQAGSKKEMVDYLVRQGIDSLSVNADMAYEISAYVLQLETNLRNARNKNPNNQKNNAQNKSILPIDDTREIERKEKQKIHQVEHNKQKQHEHAAVVTLEKEESKKESDEFPEFEIGFDPFKQQ